MQRDPRAFLWDVRESTLAIESFTKGMDAAAYEASLAVALSDVIAKYQAAAQRT